MKVRFFWGAIVVISLSFIINLIYAQSKRLAEPIFIDHYIEASVHQYPRFYYLTNRDDPTTVVNVVINDERVRVIQNNDFFSDDEEARDALNEQTYNQYALRSFQIAGDDFLPEEAFEEGRFIFDEMTIYFSNGTELTTPIGLVILHETMDDADPLESYAITSPKEGGSIYSYRSREDLEIGEFTGTFNDLLQNDLIIQLNIDAPTEDDNLDTFTGTNLEDIDFPITLKENQLFQLYGKITSNLTGVIDFPLYISGITAKGEAFVSRAWLNNQQFYLEKNDIEQIIKKRSRGESK